VVFVDDLHWADEATLTVIGRLARRAARHPLVLLLAYTPGEEPEGKEAVHLLEGLRREGIGLWIRVGRLPLEAITHWLASLFREPAEDLRELARRLYGLTEGNALFTAELLRAVRTVEGGFRRELLERYLEGPAASSSLRSLVLERVARLPEGAREILEIAAVIGRAFPLQWLELVGPPDPTPHLRILLERHFVREEAEERLSFVHEVVRRVIYEAIPPVVRRRQHRRLAKAMVALYGPHPGPYSAEIAYHFQRAGRSALPAMVRYAVEAGDHARRTYGFRQAVRHYDEALHAAWGAGDEGMAEWIRRAYLGRGMALEALGDWEGIVETYTRFREWAEAQGDRLHALNAARRLMTTLTMLGRLEEAGGLAGEIRGQFADVLSPAEADLLDRAELVFGEEPAGLPLREPLFQPAPPLWGRPWKELAEALAPEQAPLLLNLYGWILTLQGMTEAAEACLGQALTIAEATAQWPHVVMGCNLRAYLQDLRGDFPGVQAWLGRGLQLVRRGPEMDWSTIWARIFQGYLALRARQLEEAQAQFLSVLTLLRGRSAVAGPSAERPDRAGDGRPRPGGSGAGDGPARRGPGPRAGCGCRGPQPGAGRGGPTGAPARPPGGGPDSAGSGAALHRASRAGGGVRARGRGNGALGPGGGPPRGSPSGAGGGHPLGGRGRIPSRRPHRPHRPGEGAASDGGGPVAGGNPGGSAAPLAGPGCAASCG